MMRREAAARFAHGHGILTAILSPVLTAALVLGPTAALTRPLSAGFTLTSSAFHDHGRIPEAYVCTGANVSPPLRWAGAPAGTRSFALLVVDPDAPGGEFAHWVLYNLPATTKALPADLGALPRPRLREGGRQGFNDFERIGYGGPCPPPGPVHHYVFTLYALDVAQLRVPLDATASQVKTALDGHVLATAVLTGVSRR